EEYRLLNGTSSWINGRSEFEKLPITQLTSELYSYSHSFVAWALFTVAVWIIWKKFPWFMLGWVLHIGIDIFSHSNEFYPTPFLFPLSKYSVNGISWAHPIFMVTNYLFLLIVYSIILFLRRQKKLSD
ncbi:MAG: metal-dependent hydrolase, partial [Candidatus Doudnabacteria bacterium]|nr:metal-dependent hydrolase [Candidatus Doudnabacteria bacterium]